MPLLSTVRAFLPETEPNESSIRINNFEQRIKVPSFTATVFDGLAFTLSVSFAITLGRFVLFWFNTYARKVLIRRERAAIPELKRSLKRKVLILLFDQCYSVQFWSPSGPLRPRLFFWVSSIVYRTTSKTRVCCHHLSTEEEYLRKEKITLITNDGNLKTILPRDRETMKKLPTNWNWIRVRRITKQAGRGNELFTFYLHQEKIINRK